MTNRAFYSDLIENFLRRSSDEILGLLTRESITVEWASKTLGFGQSALNQYLHGKIPPNPDVAAKFARLMGISAHDFGPLISLEIEAMASGATSQHRAQEPGAAYNVRGVTPKGRVSLISWVQAGLWSEIADNFAPGKAEDWVELCESRPSRHTFALTVVGDSMTSPYVGPDVVTFPAGTITRR